MGFGFRRSVIAMAAASCLGAGAARAGDDGSAPLWEGLSSIVTPLIGLGGKDDKPALDYRERGKIVVPKSMDLPQPGATAVTTGGAWPVNQEIERKRIAKEEEKKRTAVTTPAKIRATQGFPNAPVTMRPTDQPTGAASGSGGGGTIQSSSVLNNLNPLGWVGLGKSATPEPEPDREWLTDPPKGYREPVAATPVGPSGQASK